MTPQKELQWRPLPNIDTDCFGCGKDNSHGLQMKFETNGEQVRSVVTVPDHLRGWNTIVHGGVLLQRFILTKSMTTDFLRPVFIGSTLTAKGYIKKQTDSKNAVMACRIYNDQGQVCARAQGRFVLFTANEFKKLQLIPDSLLDRMAQLLGNEETITG
jgi:hypothetical protein